MDFPKDLKEFTEQIELEQYRRYQKRNRSINITYVSATTIIPIEEPMQTVGNEPIFELRTCIHCGCNEVNARADCNCNCHEV